jgi:hypothetical protein
MEADGFSEIIVLPCDIPEDRHPNCLSFTASKKKIMKTLAYIPYYYGIKG